MASTSDRKASSSPIPAAGHVLVSRHVQLCKGIDLSFVTKIEDEVLIRLALPPPAARCRSTANHGFTID
jgi:hypothetical protein